MIVRRLFLLVAVALTAQAVFAQSHHSQLAGDSVAAVSDTVTVKLVTFYPGNESFSLYGHTELRVTWGFNDWYFNYGVFDFSEPFFVYRFVKGSAEYLCMGLPPQFAAAGMEGRRMVEQELNLTQEQAVKVRDFLINNARPENCRYVYQYLGDNCSTRPRDIIEMAVGPSLQYPAVTDSLTYRQMMAQCTRNSKWLQMGIDLILGPGIDQPLTIRQQMFIPMALKSAVDGATHVVDGKRVPLVRHTEVVVDGSEEGLDIEPEPWWATPLFAGIILLIVTVAVTVRDMSRRRCSRWLDVCIALLYSSIGLVIYFLMFVSVREATFPNYNALWANPFYLIPLGLMWSRRTRKALRLYHVINGTVAVLTIVLWPLLPQVANVAFFPMMVVPVLRAIANVHAR